MLRKKHIILKITAVVLIFMIPLQAHAAFHGFLKNEFKKLGERLLNVTVEAIYKITSFFAMIISAIGGVFVALGAFFVNLSLRFNLDILQPGGIGELIETGWGIVRDVANLGFALAIIMIAIAIILRFKEYGSGRLLMKFIAVAIIVNFSLTIAAVFIDFSHVLTAFFFSRFESTTGAFDIGNTFAAAFEPQNLYIEVDEQVANSTKNAETDALTESVSTYLILIGSQIFKTVFVYLTAFVLFVFAFMLLIRYITLAFLLIISPAVWLFWIIPPLAPQFKRWWNKFLQWVFFAPGVAFFFYLVFFSLDKLKSGVGAVPKNQFFPQGEGLLDVFLPIAGQGAKMVVISGLLLGGLLLAKELSITGASGSLKMLSSAKQKATKWAGQKTKEAAFAAGRRAATTPGIQKAATGIGALYGRLPGWGKFLAGTLSLGTLPMVGKGAQKVAEIGTKQKTVRGETAEKKAKSYDPYSLDQTLKILASSGRATNSEEVTARLIAAINKGASAEQIKETGKLNVIKNAVRKTGQEDKLLAIMPELATDFGKSIPAAAQKVENAAKLEVTSLENIEVAQNINLSQLANGSQEQRKAVIDAYEKDLGKDLADIKKQEKLIRMAIGKIGKNAPGSPEYKAAVSAKNTAEKALRTIVKGLTDSQRRSYYKRNEARQNPYFHDVITPLNTP